MSVISIIDFNILLIIREISMIDAFYYGVSIILLLQKTGYLS